MTPPQRAERLGIFGGTFDPPHIGHLAAAVNVGYALDLDRVLLVVANDPWQKRGSRPITGAQHRLAMATLAAQGLPGVEVDDREVRRGGSSYTVETLIELREEAPGCSLFVIVGDDAAKGLPSWHRPAEVAALATIVIVGRPGLLPSDRVTAPDGKEETYGFRSLSVETPAIDVSSTMIRGRVRRGEPIDVLVPAGVASHVGEHDLYSVDR